MERWIDLISYVRLQTFNCPLNVVRYDSLWDTSFRREPSGAGSCATDLIEEDVPNMASPSDFPHCQPSRDELPTRQELTQSTQFQDRDDEEIDRGTTASQASLESILRTEELTRRPSRPPDYRKENSAMVSLSNALTDSPRTVLQTLAETILDVCQSGSAGVSLLTAEDNGKHFYWPAIAGQWKPHIGGGTPRDFGPCGDVLDRNRPLLFHHVELRYTYFKPVTPSVEEALLVPFYVDGKAVGTIWAVAHDDRRKFEAEDERLMTSLGKFASSAYRVLVSLDALTSSSRLHPQVINPALCVSALHLSDRQLRIATFVAEGYSNRDIAKELNLTEQVVKNVVHSLFDRLGVWNRVELANYFSSGATEAAHNHAIRSS